MNFHKMLLLATLLPASALAADIVLTPPAGGGVAVTNSAGNSNRFRVADDGTITISGNLTLTGGLIDLPATTTVSQGYISKGGFRFLHNFGTQNTFLGILAGTLTLTGFQNTGIGNNALAALSGGSNNSAIGDQALRNLTTSNANTAVGSNALYANISGGGNTAVGYRALALNTSSTNTAVGLAALANNTSGFSNTALGDSALGSNTSGPNNIALGAFAGSNWTTGGSNIALGSTGLPGESSTMRLGSGGLQTRTFIAGINGVTTAGAATPVLVDASGQLGTVSSSRLVKDRIVDMDAASEALMRLRPVTFHYTSHGPDGPLQYGLVAEEVGEIYPDLVMHGADGKIQTVMYQYLPPMLLNEYQKQQRAIESQQRTIARQGVEIAELKQMVGQLIAQGRKQ